MQRRYTLGGLQIEREGRSLQLPTQKARDLLGHLVTFRERRHPRSVLAGVVRSDLSPGWVQRRLSDTLGRVRRLLGECQVRGGPSTRP